MVMLAPEDDPKLIRLHPESGGVSIKAAEQYFHGVSPDVFLGLDNDDPSTVRYRTCKLNLGVSIDPALYPPRKFFSDFTCNQSGGNPFDTNALSETNKCVIHGDEATGLQATQALKGLLQQYGLLNTFQIGNKKFLYDSVGVAANPDYAAVSHRVDNPFENKSSHLEIKFRRLPIDTLPEEYLCLNLHLTAAKDFGKQQVIERLCACLNLFRTELGLTQREKPQTKLQDACLYVTPENYEQHQFLCQHPASQKALERNKDAQAYRPPAASSTLSDYLPPELKAAEETSSKEKKPKRTDPAWAGNSVARLRAATSRAASGSISASSTQRPPTEADQDPFPPLSAAALPRRRA